MKLQETEEGKYQRLSEWTMGSKQHSWAEAQWTIWAHRNTKCMVTAISQIEPESAHYTHVVSIICQAGSVRYHSCIIAQHWKGHDSCANRQWCLGCAKTPAPHETNSDNPVTDDTENSRDKHASVTQIMNGNDVHLPNMQSQQIH